MDPQELLPLEAGLSRSRPKRQCSHPRPGCPGSLRACRLLALAILVPSAFITVPIYLRYRVYSGQMYPMSMTDMRLIDSKISPTWCQRQVVRSNTTFNAFVVPGQPTLADELVPVSMTRELELEDDMKEYWGFYLLRGSSVTVSACVSSPGASLIMIKGYKHLHECAYIGDNSSEEVDELMEANALGLLSNAGLLEKLRELKKIDGKANDPSTMRRHKQGVSFHDAEHPGVNDTVAAAAAVDDIDQDPKELREILERLHALRQAAKTESLKHYQLPSHLMAVPALHRHRDTNVDRDERRWLSFKDIDGSSAQETNRIQLQQTQLTTTEKPIQSTVKIEKLTTMKVVEIDNNYLGQHRDGIVEDGVNKNEVAAEVLSNQKSQERDTNHIDKANGEKATSKEVFEDVLHRLQALGDRGKRVLAKLHQTMGVDFKEEELTNKSSIMSAVQGSGEELDHLRRVLVEAIDEEKTRSQRQQKRVDAMNAARAKRELMLGQIELTKDLNEDDEPRNIAAEENPDGYADHHVQLNETTALDMSKSEFWSSFSSSEEALLECEGLILNLPLTPHSKCSRGASSMDEIASKANALTYRVPSNGYYFFVFNSENEVVKNLIRAKFDLQKTRYDVARSKLRECTNSTDRCDLSLDIFSSQKVVLEVPLRNNDSLWNEQFVIISECEPRTSVYIFCVLAVPVLILVFAFQ